MNRTLMLGWTAAVWLCLGLSMSTGAEPGAALSPPVRPELTVADFRPALASTLPAPTVPVSNSPPEIQLTGIVDLGTKKWAFMTSVERGQPAKQYSLREGERLESLEVLTVDARAERVLVRNAGVGMVLTFRTHGRQAAEQTLAAEQKFVEDHVRAHQRHQQRERERIERERAEFDAGQHLPMTLPAALEAPLEPETGLSPVSSAVFSPDGTRLITSAPDGTARIWDTTIDHRVGALKKTGGYP